MSEQPRAAVTVMMKETTMTKIKMVMAVMFMHTLVLNYREGTYIK